MKFTVSQKELFQALAIVNRAVSLNTTLPVLGNILIKAEGKKLYLTSTNLEIAIKYSIEAEIINEGAITIPSKIFSNYISLLKESTVSVSVEDGLLVCIKSKNENFKIKGISQDEFPIIPNVDKTDFVRIKTSIFKEMAQKVVFSASNNISRPVLTGVYLDVKNGVLKLVSTDSYRLSEYQIDIPSEKELTAIIPAKTLIEVIKILNESDENIDLFITKNQVLFEHNSASLSSRLIDGVFPDYEKIIPKQNKIKIQINKEELLLAVKKVSLFLSDGVGGVKILVKSGVFKISAEEGQTGGGEIEIPIDYSGEENEVSLNANFLIDLLTELKENIVLFEMDGKLAPITITQLKNNGYLHIIMPLRA